MSADDDVRDAVNELLHMQPMRNPYRPSGPLQEDE